MTNVVQFPDHDTIEEAAALWLARLDRGNLSSSESQELMTWLEADPHHREAVQQLAHLWGEMDALQVLSDLFPLRRTPRREFSWLRDHMLGAAVACATFVVGFALVLGDALVGTIDSLAADPTELVYQTEIGKQSRVELSDGSTMILNTGSRARVRLDDNARAIYLEDGEAYFDVAKNPSLPFVVYAGEGRVLAIGTAFSVRISDQKVDVAVSHGIVEVATTTHHSKRDQLSVEISPKSPPQPLTSITLKAGGVVNYQKSIEDHTYIEPQQIENKLAWTKGKWVFKGDALADVIAEANRYTDQLIEITDPTVAQLRVGGYFDVGEVESLLATLERGFAIKVTRIDPGLIQLSARDETAVYSQ